VKKLVFAIALTVSVFLAGCEEFANEEDFYTVKVKPEKTREIDTLKLEQKADANEGIETSRPSEDQVKLTIEQCRAMALKNNLDLKVQLIEPAMAAERVNAEEAKFESAFFSNLRHNKLNQPIASDLALAGSNIESDTVDLGVQMPLKTGGTVTFDLADNRTKTNFAGAMFNPSYSATGALSISQPLLRGAGKRANTHSIRILEYQRQIIESMTKLEMIRVLANADRGYWRLYAARRELEVRQKEYELAQAQLEQTRRMVRSGEKAAVEEIRSEAGVAERLDAIIRAQKELQDRERELKQIMNEAGLSIGSPTAVVPVTEPDPLRYELDKQQLSASAVENRMEMLELELAIAQDASTVQYYENQALPLVSMDYTYRMNGLGEVRNDAYDMLYERDFEDHIVGMQLIVPLGNEAAKSRLLEAYYRRRQRLVTKENRRALIEMEVLGAVEQLEANWQSILASRQNAILAGRLYEAEKRQFTAGLRTSTDVLNQQAKFANAQSAEIRALTEYQIAQVDLAYATGTLLGAAKIRWEPTPPDRQTIATTDVAQK
jgi:outer membrane protein TolC